MAFKYLNPGYINLFGLGSSIGSQENSYIYNPINGIDFYSTDGFIFPIPSAKEYWLQGTIYYSSESGGDDENWFGLYTGSHHVRIRASNDNNTYGFYIRMDNKNLNSKFVIGFNGIYKVLLHVKSDSSNGLIEFYVNKTLAFRYVGNVCKGNNLTSATFKTYNWNGINKYSNIIISDTDIGLNEQVIICPIKNISNNWKEFGYGHKAVLNSSFNCQIDKEILSTSIGTDSVIKTIQTNGININYDSSTINSINDIITDGTSIINGTIKTIENNSFVSDSKSVNPITNKAWDISDFDTNIFGIKAVYE